MISMIAIINVILGVVIAIVNCTQNPETNMWGAPLRHFVGSASQCPPSRNLFVGSVGFQGLGSYKGLGFLFLNPLFSPPRLRLVEGHRWLRGGYWEDL